MTDLFGRTEVSHQSQMDPRDNKFHVGNGEDGKHYWLTPWSDPAFVSLTARYGPFDFDPCPYPKPDDFDGLTNDWGARSYVNPPFGSIMHMGKKKGPTAWARKAIAEAEKGKRVVLVYPIDKWVLMLLGAGAKVENLGDVRWLATEDGSQGKGTGRHIAAFILEGDAHPSPTAAADADAILDEDRMPVWPTLAADDDRVRIAVEAIWEIAGGRAADGHNEAGRLARIKDRAAEALAALKSEGK